MKKSFLFSTLMALAVSFVLVSCSKEEEIGPNDKNSVILEFDNYVGNEKLVLDTKTYKNAANEDFTVTTLNYFVSNIALKKADGTEVKFPNQYFLVRQADTKSLNITLKDVPAGDYTSISYVIGVDSLKSTSDVSQRTGALDPASYGTDNMYWSWNSGYIFFKLEGNSSVATTPTKKFQFHVGGFGGMNSVTANNLRTVSVSFGTTSAQVRKNVAPTVHLITDVLQTFSQGVSIAKTSVVMNPAASKPIVDGYTKMFKVDHVHNDKM
ncbi:hypothetical protein P1X15_08955 [Runella sp. MFBS21]|uniref:MbnP family protein n=1 Tax=Runella sp. MFBS21 TaxID=3034018 RepID=UPI0023F69C6A|nr:MbnP family protein [Runella sp. MFBS21]MDF7817724.1 hypothetical protein [Runella sp. MFBS21]